MKTDLEKFINKGICEIGEMHEAVRKDERTYIVVGVARGGTSLLAGVLHKLGIFMGSKSCPPVYEDVYLAQTIEEKGIMRATEIIREYDSDNRIWGFKRPALINYLHEYHSVWRNPIYLFVFRDMAAIANRNRLSMGGNFKDYLSLAYNDYGKILSFIAREPKICGVAFSFEKLVKNKEFLIDYVVNILKVDSGEESIKNAIDFVEDNPPLYLDKTRVVD